MVGGVTRLEWPPMRPMDIDSTFVPYLKELVREREQSIDLDDVASRRARMKHKRLSTSVTETENVVIVNHTLELPSHSIPIRTYRPRGAHGLLPVILYIHGGGWMYGSPAQSDSTAIEYCARTQAVVVSPEYRLAPEWVFPAAFDDCFAVLRWLYENKAMLDIDSERVALAGESSGGNLAAACALEARCLDQPPIRLQLLNYPALAPDFSSAAYQENEHAPVLSAREMIYFWQSYLPSQSDTPDFRAAPLGAKDLADVAPTYIVTAEYDPLRDDGIRYADALSNAGIEVTHVHAAHFTHGFMRAWSASRAANSYAQDNCVAINAAFGC
jgi:acetyl esterase